MNLLELTCFILPLSALPGLLSAATVPRWAVLAVFVPMMLWSVDVSKVPGKFLLLWIFSFAAISLLWVEVPLDGQAGLWQLALLLATFCIGTAAGKIERALVLMALSVAVTLPLVLLQLLGYDGIPQVAPPGGLFLNKNVLAETAAALLIPVLWYKRWWLAAALVLILIAAREKAAYVGLGLAVVVWAWNRHPRSARALALSGLPVLGYFATTTSATARFDIWMDTLAGMTWLGHGVGSFYTAFPAAASHMDILTVRPEHAHNEILHFAFEMGAGALFVGLLAFRTLLGRHELEKLMLLCILGEGIFAFPLHMPTTAFLAALVAGRLCASECLHGDLQSFGRTQNV